MNELTVPATLDNLTSVQNFVESQLEENDCPLKVIFQISVAVEEIFVNIAHYAYTPQVGKATIRCCIEETPLQAVIQFYDSGKPFNPLEKIDADTALSADEREPGGLGILMVKKSMDSIKYEYINEMNILTIKKKL